jgi:membrane fusion protein (multidrug efflux system)
VAAPAAQAPAAPSTRRSKPKPILIALLLGAGVLVGGWWIEHRGLESTDDAQLDGDVVAVSSRGSGTVLRVDFEDNAVVPEGALLVELDDARAKANLARAEAELQAAKANAAAAEATAELAEKSALAGKDIASASLTGANVAVSATGTQIDEAEAVLKSATARRDQAQLDFDRTQRLVQTGSLPSAQLESAKTELDRTEAEVDQAEAKIATLKRSTSEARARVSEASARLGEAKDTISARVAQVRANADAARAQVSTATALRDLAKLELSYMQIRAPRAGIVSKRSVSVGQVVAVGQPVAMLSPDPSQGGQVWVTGNFKETQLERLRVGQPASLTIDAYDRELHGHVQSFSGATGSRFALLPPDNASGNFTKVVQRVPVRVQLDDVPSDLRLLPGMSVELTIDTRL